MRRVIIISYTETGRQLNSRIVDFLVKKGDVAVSFCCGSCKDVMSTKDGSVVAGDDYEVMSTEQALRQEWNRSSAFVFIGAMGIAVRQVAPFLKSKVYDPAVLVLDEKGQYVIPVLSGHIGGGVALARELAGAIGGQAVITTATDVEERFAVDVFAHQNHLRIENPGRIKTVSSALLQDRTVDVWTSLFIEGEMPEGLRFLYAEEMTTRDLSGQGVMPMELPGREDGQKDFSQREVTEKALPTQGTAVQKVVSDIAVLIDLPSQLQDKISKYYDSSQVCVLKPRRYILGIGCKRGKTADEMEAFLRQICGRQSIDIQEIGAIASIDVKKDEPGIWELSRRLGVPFEVFSAQELEGVADVVTASDFVKETVGVDNVCERSAYCLAGQWTHEDVSLEVAQRAGDYSLVLGKQAQDGMTMAIVKAAPQLVW